MLYHLFDWLTKEDFRFPGSGLFQFITFRVLLAMILSLVITTVYGKKIIRFLQKKQLGETVRDLGLAGQNEKKGTPTMFDWINGITADATTAFRAVVFLAAAVIFFVVAAKVRFAMATTIITQYGGPDGELSASLRYLSQRYAMPFDMGRATLTDIGTEELVLIEVQCGGYLGEDDIVRLADTYGRA